MAKTQLKFLLFWVCILLSLVTKGVNGQCSTPPINQAVYEGTPNTFLTCNSPTKVAWIFKPTTDELSTYTLTNYNDIVAPSYTNLFGVNSTGLTVKNAQTSGVTPPISTSGIYGIKINGSTIQYAAKLVVVRVGPTCTCNALNSSNIQLNCSITYADLSTSPINAKMSWTADGNFYKNDTPLRTKPNSKEYISSSVQTVNGYYPPNYQCTVTFGAPTSISVPYIATNAPVFSASCTVPFCGYTTPEPATTTLLPITTGSSSTTGCDCSQTTGCPSLDQNCTRANECRTVGTNLTYVYEECVVKAELYAKCDNCCPESLVCGVVVTLRNDSRWLIHDPLCNDNRCEMVVFDASCMSSGWKLLTDRKVMISGVGDYVQAGNGVQIGQNATDCSESSETVFVVRPTQCYLV